MKALPISDVGSTCPCRFHRRGTELLNEDEFEVESSPLGWLEAAWLWLWAQLPKAPRPDEIVEDFPVNDNSGDVESAKDECSAFVMDIVAE